MQEDEDEEEWPDVSGEDEDGEDLEGEVITYGYELVDDDDDEDDENADPEDPSEQAGVENLGPEDGEAEDEHDGYCGYYAPL